MPASESTPAKDMQAVIEGLEASDDQLQEMVATTDDSWVKFLAYEKGSTASCSSKLLALAKRRAELAEDLALLEPWGSKWAFF